MPILLDYYNFVKNMKKKVKIVKKPSKKVTNSEKTFGKITPLGDRILLKPESTEKEKVTDSGIIIPDTVSKERPEQGIVIAVGEGKWENGKRIPVGVKVGDKVVFSRYGYEDIKIDGEEFYILKEENILAIINTK